MFRYLLYDKQLITFSSIVMRLLLIYFATGKASFATY